MVLATREDAQFLSDAVQGDGDKIVSAARDGTIRCWDVEHKRPRSTLQGTRGCKT